MARTLRCLLPPLAHGVSGRTTSTTSPKPLGARRFASLSKPALPSACLGMCNLQCRCSLVHQFPPISIVPPKLKVFLTAHRGQTFGVRQCVAPAAVYNEHGTIESKL